MDNPSAPNDLDLDELLGAFCKLEDPRKSPATRHLFHEMLFIALTAVLAGAEGFVDIENFAKSKKDWLHSFLKLPKGIPSHDAFGDLFALLEPEAFNEAFVEWTSQLREDVSKEVVAFDGKTMRGSHDRSRGKAMVHTVSAWASSNRLVLGQIATEEKSNEVTAIPKLLKLLHLEGCVVTIDALGTQKTIAAEIIEQRADYILALKENHATFHEEVKELMEAPETLQDFQRKGAPLKCSIEEEKSHGRIEKRSCVALEATDWYRESWQWEGLKTLIMIERSRKKSGDEVFTVERHFYISSLPAEAAEIAGMVRSHWGIENSLHWVLDVTYREDASRVRKGHAASNLSTLRKWTLNILQNASGPNSIRQKRKKAGWDHQYLLNLLFF